MGLQSTAVPSHPPVEPSHSPALATPSLSPAQKEQYERDGYLVLRNFFPVSTASSLLARAKELLHDFSLEEHPLTVFNGSAEDEHVGNEYFLTSGNKVRFFFEASAFDSIRDESGQVVGQDLNRPKEEAINKIGHALHDLDPAFRHFTLENEEIKSIGREFFTDPRVIQSMVICKQREVGGAVNTHDDSTFLFTDPPSAMGMWFALERCTDKNGCLSFLPGSHLLNSPIPKRLVRVEGGKGGTKIVPWGPQTDAIDWDAWTPDESKRERVWKMEPCEVGDLVLIHGSVIHRSEANLSDKSRFIYTFHLIEGDAVWDELNWLQPAPGEIFTPLL